LRKLTGQDINYFCYPNARYDSLAVSRVLASGYSHGFRMHNLRVTNRSRPELVPRFSAADINAAPSLLKYRMMRAGPG
jgi:hypothetical protein